jgi:hypothetical protein
MKNALILLIAASFALGCAHEDQMPIKGKVQFAVAPVAESSSGGRVMSHPFPDGAYISLSIETATGTSVYSLERIDLIQLGSGYVTVPLELTEGSYRVTDFFVMSEGGDVLYATPKEGSPLAGLVADPLPINFSIAADGILNLHVQVVDVNQQSPEDFGYVSFGVEVVGGDYAVSLFIDEGDGLSFTSGKLELYQGNDLIHSQELKAKVNQVNFKGDSDATYTLLVKKEGYTIKKKEYVLHELIDELNGKPLSLVLEPAFTIMVKHHDMFDDNLPMTFNLSLIGVPGAPYKIKIDWGDGTVQSIEDNFRTDNGWSPTQFYLHYYAADLAGERSVINITGDLSYVDFFFLPNPLPLSITNIDIASLRNITVLRLGGSEIAKNDLPENIDISMNGKLNGLDIGGSPTKFLDISHNPLLTRANIRNTDLSNNNVNQVIMDFPEISGTTGYNDFFSFGQSSNSDEQNLTILTEESRLKLILLRDTYGWQIYPNPQ